MQPKEGLEEVVISKIRPLIDQTTEKILGMSIDKLSDDISAKVAKSSFFDTYEIKAGIKYRDAKSHFRKAYLIKALLLNLGNVSEVAKLLGMDRRSVHRMIEGLKIDVRKIKKDMVRPYNIKLSDMNLRIEQVLDTYKEVIHPVKLESIYKNVNDLSDNILKELPEQLMPLKDAEDEFERRYFEAAIKENDGNITLTAKKIGLRHETLFRKVKALGINAEH
jgi:DNA-binding NtrC family response regulator